MNRPPFDKGACLGGFEVNKPPAKFRLGIERYLVHGGLVSSIISKFTVPHGLPLSDQ